MFRKVKKATRDVKSVKTILATSQNRLIAGVIILGVGIGLGGGLVASAYIHI